MSYIHENRLSIAYSKLSLREPFIAAVMTRIRREISDEVPTAATDGTRVIYNPDFMDKCSDEELFGLTLHESLHIILMHMWRRGERCPKLWNVANDAIINAYIRKRSYHLPEGGVDVDWVRDNMDSEYVYKRMKQDQDEKQQQSGGDGDGDGDDDAPAGGFDGTGDLMDAPSDATVTDLEATIVASAEMAKACGQGSALIDNILKGTGKSRVDWRNEMRAMLTSASNDDYTYRRPSRRFIAQGTYLPSLYSEGLGPVLIAIDSSASMTQQELCQIASETQQIFDDLNPAFVRVVYCDTQIQRTQDFQQGDDVELSCRGGGGTRFKPVFDYLEDEMPEAVGLVYFTDLEGNTDECREPHCPVIWANTGGSQRSNQPKFGVVANVEI
jgi:predicted metal-dependent peptidase